MSRKDETSEERYERLRQNSEDSYMRERGMTKTCWECGGSGFIKIGTGKYSCGSCGVCGNGDRGLVAMSARPGLAPSLVERKPAAPWRETLFFWIGFIAPSVGIGLLVGVIFSVI